MVNLIIKNLSKLSKDNPIILAVSGGIDSMVLLDILYKLKFNIVVAHVNHNVREESNEEAEFVKKTTLEKNYVFEYKKLDKITLGNFHEEARRLRYDFFFSLVDKYNAQGIITAHHADDLVETILMKISRGSNILGYSGINLITYVNNTKIVRPLLNTSKDEIINYQKKFNIEYREDSSNLKDKYTRNRYRHNIIPLLKEENKALYLKYFQFSETLSEAHSFIRKTSIGYLNSWRGKILIDEFNSLDTIIKKDILAFLLERKNLEISFNKINDIIELLNNNLPNSKYSLDNNLIFQKNYNNAYIIEKNEIINYEIKVFSIGEYIIPNVGIVKITKNIPSKGAIFTKICYNTLDSGIIIRNRRASDYYQYTYGRKKIKDLFIDCKIPIDERNTIPIICDDKNNILGIPGIITGSDNIKDSLFIIYERSGGIEQ